MWSLQLVFSGFIFKDKKDNSFYETRDSGYPAFMVQKSLIVMQKSVFMVQISVIMEAKTEVVVKSNLPIMD